MFSRSTLKNSLVALTGAVLFGSLAWTAPAEAGHRHGGGGYRDVVVHRVAYRPRPVVRRVVIVERPIIYRPRPVVRRVVVVERPYDRRANYGYGWRHRVGWHDRPRCWLPERHLCR